MQTRPSPPDRHFPLVSIRIPSFNHRQFVEQALDSVIQDSYPNKELVIIDDGSTDDSAAVISRWIDTNGHRIAVNYSRHPRNLGIARTLNELVKRCAGEYIAGVASDDYLLPDGILQRYLYLQEHPEKLAVFGDCLVVDGAGQLMAESGLTGFHHANLGNFRSDASLRKELITNWSVPGPVLMVNRRVLEVVGPYNENLGIEDWDFYLRMAAQNLIGFLDRKVGAYRVHGKNYCMISEKETEHLKSLRKTLWINHSRFSWADKWHIFKKIAGLSKGICASRLLKKRPERGLQ